MFGSLGIPDFVTGDSFRHAGVICIIEGDSSHIMDIVTWEAAPGNRVQQTQNICITFIQRRPNVFDIGPTLYKCYTNVLCLLDRYLSQTDRSQ